MGIRGTTCNGWFSFGLQGVGKSCLVLRYVRGQFDAGSKVTIGAAFMSHTITLPSNASVKFEIWRAFSALTGVSKLWPGWSTIEPLTGFVCIHACGRIA